MKSDKRDKIIEEIISNTKKVDDNNDTLYLAQLTHKAHKDVIANLFVQYEKQIKHDVIKHFLDCNMRIHFEEVVI